MGKVPEEVFLAEHWQLREGQVGFKNPTCASARYLHLVGKAKVAGETGQRKAEKYGRDMPLAFSPAPPWAVRPLSTTSGLLCYVLG